MLNPTTITLPVQPWHGPLRFPLPLPEYRMAPSDLPLS